MINFGGEKTLQATGDIVGWQDVQLSEDDVTDNFALI